MTALIVQNKGGGHAELGYHLALHLLEKKGLRVTMINDSAAKTSEPPFDSYMDLEAAGVDVRWVDLAEKGRLATTLSEEIQPCDYIFDNQNVCPEDVQKVVSTWNPKLYVYVSSGGMYLPVADGPLLETGGVKEDNPQLQIERRAAEAGLPWVAFRPQYIYGPKTHKRDYIDWFLDRIIRRLPTPLPEDGKLTTTLTHAKDIASMLASVVGREDAARGQVFNCASDRTVTHQEIVAACAAALGKSPAVVLGRVTRYSPAKMKGRKLPGRGKFPFRETHFAVGVQKAKDLLGWEPKHKLRTDLPWYVQKYVTLGKDQGPLGREWDEAVLEATGADA